MNCKKLRLFNSPVLDIIGNINSNLYVRTTNELLLVKRKVENFNNFCVFKTKIFEDEQDIFDDDLYNILNFEDDDIDNRQKINADPSKNTYICRIINNCIVTVESGIIITRNSEKLEFINELTYFTEYSFFKENILIIDEKKIIFYSVPNF